MCSRFLTKQLEQFFFRRKHQKNKTNDKQKFFLNFRNIKNLYQTKFYFAITGSNIKIRRMRRGLRIQDDQDTQVKQERITLDANRKKDNFEKDMDNFLFGGPPVKRRQIQKEQAERKAQKPAVIKQQPLKPQPELPKKPQPVINRQSSQPEPKKIQRSFQNPSLKGSKVEKAGQTGIPVKKTSSGDGNMGQGERGQTFQEIQTTRPNYIRKLRFPAQSHDFIRQNSEQHKFVDVVRPNQCLRSHVTEKNTSNFKDRQFPAHQISLGLELQAYDVTWKRCEEFFDHSNLGKYIDPNDIKKGRFSSSKFLSSLSVLSQREQNIKRLIQDQFLSPNGICYVRLFINSIWRYYVLDSYFPVSQSNNGGAVSYNDSQSDLWVTLIQKAYAKAFNGYNVFTKAQPTQHYLRDLTGAPTSNFMIDHPQILNIVKKAVQHKKVIAAHFKSNAVDLGINPNNTLTVLNTNKKGGLTLRYSWPLVKEKCGIQISKQGVLDLTEAQMSEYVSKITVAHVNRQYYTTTVQTRHQKQFYVAYKVIIRENTHGYFTVSQLDQRMFPKERYAYRPARLFLHKKNDKKYQYVAGGFNHMSRNLDIQVNLTPGQYHVFAFINWDYLAFDFNLTFYAQRPIQLVKIPTLKNHNLISLGLQSYNLQYGKRSALGHCNQFIIHHQITNQILITITNTSAKSYKYSHDLKKIIFQSLHLMNLTNNQDNILQNYTKEQLQNYKLQALYSKKWDIELGPLQVFTWIISTNEIYDPNIFRNWGFR